MEIWHLSRFNAWLMMSNLIFLIPVLSFSCRLLLGSITNVLNTAGGHGLINDYNRLKKCPVGNAVVGRGFDLPCDWVIHTSTPKYLCKLNFTRRVAYGQMHASEEDEAKLRACYSSVLSICKEKGIRTIAFPSLGAKAHRYPLAEATKVGMSTILNFLGEDDLIDRIVLCTHNGRDSVVVKNVVEECLKGLQ